MSQAMLSNNTGFNDADVKRLFVAFTNRVFPADKKNNQEYFYTTNAILHAFLDRGNYRYQK